jgi:hypothetical protein
MPPLICCSPTILDQSFPRNINELHLILDTLVKIQDQLARNEIHLILTDVLAELVTNVDWNIREEYAILKEIYRLLNMWFLQPHEGLVPIDVSKIVTYYKHPIPEGCESKGLIDFWSDEVGKILSIHDRCCSNQKFFIGIACESAYCTNKRRYYINPDSLRVFPLVGPTETASLDDGYYWEVRHEIRRINIPFRNVLRNYRVIGSNKLERPHSSSHWKLKFKGGRTWTLDANIDPVAEDHLEELEAITGYPIQVIKYAFINGKLPGKKIRFGLVDVA